MNKAGLVADLAAYPFVVAVGTPTQEGTIPAIGVTQYLISYVQTNGKAASFLNQRFYVYHDGLPDEVAYYMDVPPKQLARETAFEAWMIAQVDAAKANFKLVQVLAKSERWQWLCYSIVTGAGPYTQKVYFVQMGSQPVEITPFNPALLGSLLKV